MPIYEFKCKKCGEEFEYTLSISERETKKVRCPSCKSTRADQTLSSLYPQVATKVSATGFSDLWAEERSKEVRTTSETEKRLLISDLRWSPEEALETYLRLRPFQDDWNAPGMELYDEL